MLTCVLTCLLRVTSSALPLQDTTIKLVGDVPTPFTLTVAELASMPRTKVTASAHNQSGE